MIGSDPLTLDGGFFLANMGVGVSYSLLSIGSGMLVGFRVNASMLLGGILAWVVAPYFLVKYGIVEINPSKKHVLYWVMWPATGMLVAGGLTALGLRWRLLVTTFTSLRSAKIDGSEFPIRWVMIGIGVCSVALCVLQNRLLGMPVWMTLAAIVLSVPLMLVGLRVLGETNWGPISALSNMMQGRSRSSRRTTSARTWSRAARPARSRRRPRRSCRTTSAARCWPRSRTS